MRKNLAVDIPRDAETEVDRIRGLKKSIFTRTRIATLCLVMVVALSVTGTLAFEVWTGNTTPNRGNLGVSEIQIGEKLNGNGTYVYDLDETGNTVQQGAANKKVRVKMEKRTDNIDSNVTVAIIPMAASSFEGTRNANGTDAYYASYGNKEYGWSSFDQTWTGEEPSKDEDGKWCIETDVLRVYLADGWNDGASDPEGDGGYWEWVDGVFAYSTTRASGEETQDLVSGVVFRDSVDVANDYTNYKLQIVARSVAATSSASS